MSSIRRLLLPTMLALGAAAAPGQDPAQPAPTPATEASPAVLQARIDEVKADGSLPAEVKTAVQDVLGRALETARTTEQQNASAATFTAHAQRAPDDLKDARARLESPSQPVLPTAGMTVAELEQGLAASQQRQSEAADRAAKIDSDVRDRADFRTNLPPRIADLRKRLDALPDQPTDVSGVDPRLAAARRLLQTAERARLRSQLDALQAQLASYDAEDPLLRANRDLAARTMTTAKAEIDAWQAALQTARAASAQAAARAAQQEVGQTDPRIVGLATENAKLADDARNLAARLARAEVEQTAADGDLRRLDEEFREMQERAHLIGTTDDFGKLLRERRAGLGQKQRAAQDRARNRGGRITQEQLERLKIDDRRSAVVRMLPNDWLQRQLGDDVPLETLPADVRDQAEQLRLKRQDLLQRLSDDYGRLIAALRATETAEREFNTKSDDYRTFLTERVLGLRSSTPIWQLDTDRLIGAAMWMVSAQSWLDAGLAVLTGVLDQKWPFAVLLPLVVLLAMRRWLRRRLASHGDVALRGTNVAYGPTALAAADTLLLALSVPAVLSFLAWRLLAGEPSDFQKALAAGAVNAAGVTGMVGLLRQLVRPRGLGEAHFRWQSTTQKLLRRNVPLLVPVGPIAFVLGALVAHGDENGLGSLGSLLLLAMFALLLVFSWRVLHPTTGLVGGAVSRRNNALYRFRGVWFTLAIGTLTTLLVMTVLGYDYTATQLARRLLFTAAAVVAGVLVHAMVLRGLVLERRRLQIRQAMERLAAQKTADGTTPSQEAPPLEEIDPQSLARQTQALLRSALVIAVLVAAYQIWVDVLPALGILRHVPLWDVDDGTGGVITITLAHLLLSLFVLAAAVVAGRNVPALLELLVLQRFRMQAGERAAITTLTRYGIVIVGVVLAFSSIGIGWSKVQWLLAAISVGLGFGLQEIFANFVSGLILLFERPIRVGDLVSVGDVIGRVNRIRIRATTIVDWDRKELVVPNREFVTGHFVNWTLTDSVVRWVIPVGVAYGTDTRKALELLEKVAAESAHVLKEPRPESVFVRFGDSTLDLNLRVFVDMSALDYRWMTELHQAIDARFREHGIEIAFPQRDVNLKIAGPTLEALQRGRADHEPARAD